MKINPSTNLKSIADLIKRDFKGDGAAEVTGINEIHKVEPGDITFVDHPKYYKKALESAATFIIINKEEPVPKGKGLIFSEDPFDDYIRLVRHFRPFVYSKVPIPTSAVIGEGTIIEPGVVIAEGVEIGKNCVIHANVVLYPGVTLGNNVVIHSNTTIGSEAFYFKKYDRDTPKYEKMISCGRVSIEDDVEIGANCTVDKGVSGLTRIGRGCKFDNHIHIGHGVEIGENCLFAAQVGVAGKTIIGNNVIIWGQVGVSKDLVIGDDVIIYAQSGVNSNLAPGGNYFGSPAIEAKEMLKVHKAVRSLPVIIENIKKASE